MKSSIFNVSFISLSCLALLEAPTLSYLVATIVILILTVIAKVVLISTKKMNPSSFGEILLILAQVLTLIGTIYGYKKKKEFTKYLSLLAAISIILTFDLFDIIIGIIYFIFSIDQGYFVSLGNFIKEKIKK